MRTRQPHLTPPFFIMDARTRSRMRHLLGEDVPPATEKMYDRLKEKVDSIGGASHPDPWILVLIAELSNKPVRPPTASRKKKVEVIPSA